MGWIKKTKNIIGGKSVVFGSGVGSEVSLPEVIIIERFLFPGVVEWL